MNFSPSYIATNMLNIKTSFYDIYNTIKHPELALMLGMQDIKQRYRRSKLGAFWLTLSMGIMIGTLGFIFGTIFDANLGEFLPFLAVGLIFWGFISTTISEGCTAFIQAEGIIKQVSLPMFTYVMRNFYRNGVILIHNLAIIPILFLFFDLKPTLNMLFLPVGFILLSLNLLWMSTLSAILCTRFRDTTQIVINMLQVVFYMTPIVWMPSLVPARGALYFLDFNPMFHLIELVRAPILGSDISSSTWIYSIIFMFIGWTFTLIAMSKFKSRIAYWL